MENVLGTYVIQDVFFFILSSNSQGKTDEIS